MTKPRVSLGRGPALWGEGGCSGSTGTAPGGQHHGAWHRTRLHGNTTLPPEEKIHTGKKKTQKTKNLPPPKKKQKTKPQRNAVHVFPARGTGASKQFSAPSGISFRRAWPGWEDGVQGFILPLSELSFLSRLRMSPTTGVS